MRREYGLIPRQARDEGNFSLMLSSSKHGLVEAWARRSMRALVLSLSKDEGE